MNYDVSTWNKIIQLDDFRWVLKSILAIGDQNSEWKADFIEFVNYDTGSGDQRFYYDMLPFVRFIDEGPNVGAYTTEDHLIWMNAPHGFGLGKEDLKWEFIYFHECLHQLWETFDVKKNIERQYGDCDHELLNIASDCVINDFLHTVKKMPYPLNGLVTPEMLKDKYGVVYDRKMDTQFRLYEKLLKVKDKVHADMPPDQFDGKTIKPGSINKMPVPPMPPGGGQDEMFSPDYVKGYTDAINDVLSKKVDPLKCKPKTPPTEYNDGYNNAITKIRNGIINGITEPENTGDDNGGEGGKTNLPDIPWERPDMPKPNGGGGDTKPGKGNSGEQKDNGEEGPESKGDFEDGQNGKSDKEKADEAAQSAQDSADYAKACADSATGDHAKNAKDAAKKAQKAADDAKAAAQKGDAKKAKAKAEEAAQAAQEAASEALKDKKEANKSNNANGGNAPSKGNMSKFTGFKPFDENEPTSSQMKSFGDKTLKKYSGKITGEFGSFLGKCKDSTTQQKEGVVVRQRSGAAWNKQLEKFMDTYIHQEVIQKQREVEQTYHRVKRGTRPVRFGDPIKPGTKIKDDKLNINVAFWLDRSGSMGKNAGKVCSLAYQLSDKVLKEFSHESVVGDIGFRYFVFDDVIEEVKKGVVVKDRGSTLPMEELFKSIEKTTKDYLVNIVITDAQFSIDKPGVVKLVKSMPGMFFMIANTPMPECVDIQKLTKNQFVFIEANDEFAME